MFRENKQRYNMNYSCHQNSVPKKFSIIYLKSFLYSAEKSAPFTEFRGSEQYRLPGKNVF
jgi:hypothetical protein